ncbi:zinc-binding metallopeptidase family protein [Arthrobacter sp. 131MFCol6.1]|uniref:zinc-binding metallopeptidase family protein n=1 Tax=Arthrobacter sp. 131MFCol6.1 TaxID=1157944 RepID=UPI000477B6BF|nr:putative zinc-binding metallopeptidase [Arthrobacter sp. 131MFCol6.1]
MKKQSCGVCGSIVYFENSVCLHCGTDLAYLRNARAIVATGNQGQYTDDSGATWHRCANSLLSGCTWLAREGGGQCFSCELTRTRPNDSDAKGLSQFVAAERAKRRLIAELDWLGLPIITRAEDPDGGLAFDLLSSVKEDVVIGHADGVITINLAESDDAYRERMRNQLDEPYRTMLGHFRHEVGHYFETVLVFSDDGRTREARHLFGDDTKDYQAEIDRHYSEGAPADWNERFISKYATMHPYEDFAESFAHYLHICDTLDTAREFGLIPSTPRGTSFQERVETEWLPLSLALNQVNRSMGKDDLYPFVLSGAVIDKLEFVHGLRAAATAAG